MKLPWIAALARIFDTYFLSSTVVVVVVVVEQIKTTPRVQTEKRNNLNNRPKNLHFRTGPSGSCKTPFHRATREI